MIDLVIGIAFGVRSHGPGESNKAIGKLVEKYAKEEDLPVIAQEEVVLALSDDFENEVETIPGNLPWKDRGNYGDTHNVAMEAKKIADRNDWGKLAILVCHPDHAWRSSKIFERQGFEVTIFREDLKDIPYDLSSQRLWTTCKWLWWPKELIYSIPMDKLRGYY